MGRGKLYLMDREFISTVQKGPRDMFQNKANIINTTELHTLKW